MGAVKDAVFKTIKFARKIYGWANYMGLFIPKVALENVAGKGIDDPDYWDYYSQGAGFLNRYGNIILPHWFTPVAVRQMDHYGTIEDMLLQQVYRSFGFKVLDGKTFR